jgi:hypothetical protein
MARGRRITRQQVLNRREALKALAALGGAAAASALVPERWVKPVVEAGVVPAHAQSSRICNLPASIVGCAITDYSWRDHHNFDFTIRVELNSPCSEIPMKWSHEVLDVNQESIYFFGFDDNLTIFTDSNGNALHRVSPYFYDPSNPYSFSISWKFANPDDGIGICTTNFVYPPRP